MAHFSVTIITPCRNAGRMLADTIASLRGQSAVQSGSVDLQHLVMDGASTDDTRDVVAKFPEVEFQSKPDSGMYDALASSLVQARGDVIGYLNAGDILHPHALDVLAEVFANPGVDWVTGYSTQINDRLQLTSACRPTRYRREFVDNGFYADDRYSFCIQQESTFWSNSLNRSVDLGRLRTFKLAGDYFLWTEFARLSELHSINSLLGAFRIHHGQLSENMADYRREVVGIIRLPTLKERFTAWWETRCNPTLRTPLWEFTLGQSPARIFDFNHRTQMWESK